MVPLGPFRQGPIASESKEMRWKVKFSAKMPPVLELGRTDSLKSVDFPLSKALWASDLCSARRGPFPLVSSPVGLTETSVSWEEALGS